MSLDTNSFSTADILRDLAKRYFNKETPVGAAIDKIANIYGRLGKLNILWADLEYDSQSIKMPVLELLDKLKAKNTPQAKSSYERLSTEINPLLQRSDDLNNVAEKIHEAYQQAQSEALGYLKSAWLAKDPAEADREIKKATTIYSSCLTQLEKEIKLRKTVNLELEDLHYRTYLALPDKSDIPSSFYTPTMRQKLGGG